MGKIPLTIHVIIGSTRQNRFSAKQKPTTCGGHSGRVPLSGGTKNRNPDPLIDSGFRVKRGMTCFFFSKAAIFDGGSSLKSRPGIFSMS